MGSKSAPGVYDCYAVAMEDEPLFTLLARDTLAPQIVRNWAKQRQYDVQRGMRPHSDLGMVQEALTCASDMEKWRSVNFNRWKKQDQKSPNARIQELEEALVSIRNSLAYPGGTRHYAEGGVMEVINRLLPETIAESLSPGTSNSMKGTIR